MGWFRLHMQKDVRIWKPGRLCKLFVESFFRMKKGGFFLCNEEKEKPRWFFLFIYLFIYLWLCWVLISVRGLSLVAASRGHSSSRCAGLSLSRPLCLRSTGSRRAGSAIVAHGPSCSAACGIFPDQGSNPCPLHWQADSQPLRHQGSPNHFLNVCFHPPQTVKPHDMNNSKWL